MNSKFSRSVRAKELKSWSTQFAVKRAKSKLRALNELCELLQIEEPSSHSTDPTIQRSNDPTIRQSTDRPLRSLRPLRRRETTVTSRSWYKTKCGSCNAISQSAVASWRANSEQVKEEVEVEVEEEVDEIKKAVTTNQSNSTRVIVVFIQVFQVRSSQNVCPESAESHWSGAANVVGGLSGTTHGPIWWCERLLWCHLIGRCGQHGTQYTSGAVLHDAGSQGCLSCPDPEMALRSGAEKVCGIQVRWMRWQREQFPQLQDLHGHLRGHVNDWELGTAGSTAGRRFRFRLAGVAKGACLFSFTRIKGSIYFKQTHTHSHIPHYYA